MVRPYLLRVVKDTNSPCVVEIQMFMQLTLVTMSIAATRMYRSLVNSYYADEYVILSFQ